MLTEAERNELNTLRKEMYVASLGDRPYSLLAEKVGRLIDLEAKLEVPVRHEIDGLEKAIQIAQRVLCPEPPHIERTPTRSRAFEAGFNVAKHVILQQLREEQNRRFKEREAK